MRISAISTIDFKQTNESTQLNTNNFDNNETEEPIPKLPEHVSLWKRLWHVLKEDEKQEQKLDEVV